MGARNSQEQEGKLNSIAYGHHRIISTKQNNTVVSKSYSLSTPEEKRQFEQLIRLFRQQLHIATVLEVLSLKEQGPLQAEVEYEYCPKTLRDDIEYKKTTYLRYTEHEILNLVDCVLSGLMAFNFHQLFHKDLRPDNIFISQDPQNPDARLYKIGYPLLMNDQTMERQYKSQQKTEIYFSPQIFESVSKYSNKPFSLQKSEVFVLGLIALEMATLVGPASIYNHNTGEVSLLEISKLVSVCNEKYSQDFVALLSDMLALQEHHRPNFQELLQIFEPLMQQSQINNMPQPSPRTPEIVPSTTYMDMIGKMSRRSARQPSGVLPIFCFVQQPSFLAQIRRVGCLRK